MLAVDERLRTLTVRDAMNKAVITVSAGDSMTQAGEVLRKHGISGAPVVDERGRLVGVLSARDFVPASATGANWCERVQELVQDYPGGPYHVEERQRQSVRDVMSTAVQTVDDDLPLVAAARCLCLEHIHRVIVVDDDIRPVGILTSLDIVAALVQSFDEGEPPPRKAH